MKNIADITTQLDPLFRQMCSAFDEGTRKQGGTAWLMSHLGMNKEGGLIFDTSEEMIDLWEEIKTEDGQESRICINIEEKFREGLRGSENSAFFKQAMLSTSRNEHVEVEAVIHEVEGDQGWEDFGEVEGTDSGLFEEEETSPISLTAQVMKSLERASELTSDPMSEQSSPLSEPEGRMDEFQMTADALSNLSFTNEDTNSLQFRYFDKSWAGPEHWKMGHLKLGSNTASAPKKERKAKIKSKFDFTMAKEVDIRSLFMKPTNPNTLRMSLEENTYVTCLPEDLGIKAESILTLFTKSIVKLGVTAKKSSKFQYNENCGIPKKAIIDGSSRDALEIFRDPKVLFCDSIEAGNGGFDDGSFDDGGNDSFHDATLQESPLGAPSQEFSRISLSGHISDLDSQAGNTPFVKPQFTAISTLQYSRTAKTIDVGLLKTSLLSSIKKSIEDNNLSRSASNATTLGKVLADLPETVIKRDEVARVHFGFMALLHLANEQGLTLRSTTNLNDITISMYN